MIICLVFLYFLVGALLARVVKLILADDLSSGCVVDNVNAKLFVVSMFVCWPLMVPLSIILYPARRILRKLRRRNDSV